MVGVFIGHHMQLWSWLHVLETGLWLLHLLLSCHVSLQKQPHAWIQLCLQSAIQSKIGFLSFYLYFNDQPCKRALYTVKNTDEKSTKSFGHSENKQPNCALLFMCVFQLSFIDCILPKNGVVDELWTTIQQKLLIANKKACFLQNAQRCLSVYCPKLSLFLIVYGSSKRFDVQIPAQFAPNEKMVQTDKSDSWLLYRSAHNMRCLGIRY